MNPFREVTIHTHNDQSVWMRPSENDDNVIELSIIEGDKHHSSVYLNADECLALAEELSHLAAKLCKDKI